jgi:hypothetical protein
MRKSLKRALELLRAKTRGTFRPKTSARRGVQEPQHMQVHA